MVEARKFTEENQPKTPVEVLFIESESGIRTLIRLGLKLRDGGLYNVSCAASSDEASRTYEEKKRTGKPIKIILAGEILVAGSEGGNEILDAAKSDKIPVVLFSPNGPKAEEVSGISRVESQFLDLALVRKILSEEMNKQSNLDCRSDSAS